MPDELMQLVTIDNHRNVFFNLKKNKDETLVSLRMLFLGGGVAGS